MLPWFKFVLVVKNCIYSLTSIHTQRVLNDLFNAIQKGAAKSKAVSHNLKVESKFPSLYSLATALAVHASENSCNTCML